MGARSEETSAVEQKQRTPVATKLHRIAEKAIKKANYEINFTQSVSPVERGTVTRCIKRLKKVRPAGIDKMTKDIYAENLDGQYFQS